MPGNESTPFYSLVGEKDSCFVGKRVSLDPIKLLRFEAPSVDIAATLRPSVIRAQQHVFPINGQYEWHPLPAHQRKLWRFGLNASRVILFGDSTMLQPTWALHAAAAQCHIEQSTDNVVSCGDFLLPPSRVHSSQMQTLYPPFLSCRPSSSQAQKSKALVSSEEEILGGFPVIKMHDSLANSTGMWVHYVNGFGCDLDVMNRLMQMLNAVQPRDILIVSMGNHCIRSITLREWQSLIEKVGTLLSSALTPHIIWRSSVPIEEHLPWTFIGVEALQYRKSTHHFLNEPRRLVFELAASAVMTRHGIRVLDLVGLPAAHYDATHYDLAGSDLHNRLLSWSICG